MIDESNNTLFIGKFSFHLSSIDSTNKFAHNLISKTNPIEGTAIRADEQTAGRGQFGSKWQANPRENITISIILCPKFLLVKQQFLLNAAMALGVYDFINEIIGYSSELTIKWPNDIYVGNQKIAGILIENSIQQDVINNSIIGIGLNINQKTFSAKQKTLAL